MYKWAKTIVPFHIMDIILNNYEKDGYEIYKLELETDKEKNRQALIVARKKIYSC
ncbi:MAG: hypothetical protein PVG65_00460 [Candidatus Thorarchaeota archaeon]|jgi:hypothetical protein